MKGIDRAAPKPVDTVQLVAFTVDGSEYALDIMRIKEIINPLPVRPVPKAPSFIEGVVELRGAILPVVDVRKRFDLPPMTPTRATKYIIVGIDLAPTAPALDPARPSPHVAARRMIVGLVVDAVSEPIRVPRDQLRPAPPLTQGTSAYFAGVVHLKGRILMVLDIDAILSSREKISLVGLDGEA